MISVLPRAGLGSAWFRLLPHLVMRLFFGRLRLRGAAVIPTSGPVLLLGRHRNGVADGYAYAAALPRPAVFMIAAGLRRHPVARLLVTGIEVVRDKDRGDRGINRRAITACVEELAAGGAVFIFPEGTSTLGPRPLPAKPGAAQVAAEFLALYGALTVVPLTIDYTAPSALGGDVEITVGVPLLLRGALEAGELHARFAAALAATGGAFADEAAQRRADAMARLADDAGHSYAAALDHFTARIPPDLDARVACFERAAAGAGLLRFQGRPVFARHHAAARIIAGAAGLVIATAGLVANLPPVAAAWLAARRNADGANEVMAWRILAGLPLALVWAALVVAGAIAALGPAAAAGYLTLTAAAARLHAPARRAFAAGINALARPGLSPLYAGAQDAVLDHLRH
jgi:1-acyl-sn-glycerol-3-phosphate acyltransferase